VKLVKMADKISTDEQAKILAKVDGVSASPGAGADHFSQACRLVSSTKSSFTGVVVKGGKWCACIVIKRKQVFIGPFNLEAEAGTAYQVAKAKRDAARKRVAAKNATSTADPKKLRSGTKSRFPCVRVRHGKWSSYVSIGGKFVNLGPFDTQEEAAEALSNARVKRDAEKTDLAQWI
jgi:hypothetical protein